MEIPKWLIVLVTVVAIGWFINESADFIGKVNKTINNANSSMNRSNSNVQAIQKY